MFITNERSITLHFIIQSIIIVVFIFPLFQFCSENKFESYFHSNAIIAVPPLSHPTPSHLSDTSATKPLSPLEACKNDAIIDKFQQYVNAVNRELASFETIKYFQILPEDFSVETGELTPTMKVKRRIVNEKYKNIIDSMYSTGNKNSSF